MLPPSSVLIIVNKAFVRIIWLFSLELAAWYIRELSGHPVALLGVASAVARVATPPLSIALLGASIVSK